MYRISHEIIKFNEKTKENWKVELIIGVKSLAEVNIKRRVFQGDALSPLLFVIAMMPHNHIMLADTNLKIARKDQSSNLRG